MDQQEVGLPALWFALNHVNYDVPAADYGRRLCGWCGLERLVTVPFPNMLGDRSVKVQGVDVEVMIREMEMFPGATGGGFLQSIILQEGNTGKL